MKKSLKALWILLVIVLAVIGAQETLIWLQTKAGEKIFTSYEKEGLFDSDLKYMKDRGKPLFLVNPSYKTNLFFIEGFRSLQPQSGYMDWFNEMHEKHKINIIVPVYGLQSSPFALRNREWFREEDMRTVTQVYDAFTSNLQEDSRIVTCSMSYGTLPHMAVAAKAIRPPDACVFLSPLNTGLDYRVSSNLSHWLSKQTGWLNYIVRYAPLAPSPFRYNTVWDIVDKDNNKKYDDMLKPVPEDNSRLGHQLEGHAAWMEKVLVPQVKGMRILMAWGDSDLFFSQDGFIALAGKIKDAANNVETLVLKDTGHMVLLDTSQKQIKKKIEDLLLQTK